MLKPGLRVGDQLAIERELAKPPAPRILSTEEATAPTKRYTKKTEVKDAGIRESLAGARKRYLESLAMFAERKNCLTGACKAQDFLAARGIPSAKVAVPYPGMHFMTELADGSRIHYTPKRKSLGGTPGFERVSAKYIPKLQIGGMERTAERVVGKTGFDYTKIVRNHWHPLIKDAMEKSNIVFDLENDDAASDDPARTIKIGDPPLNHRVVLHFAGGDWENPVAYFRCQDYSKCFVLIPPSDAGNANLEKTDRGWRASQDDKDRKNPNCAALWRWVEHELQQRDKTAANTLVDVTPATEQHSGLDVQQPLLRNPYLPIDPERATEYENGYEYAMSMGHMGIQQYDIESAMTAPGAWREGFAEAARKLGRADLADQIPLPEKTSAWRFGRKPIADSGLHTSFTNFNLDKPGFMTRLFGRKTPAIPRIQTKPDLQVTQAPDMAGFRRVTPGNAEHRRIIDRTRRVRTELAGTEAGLKELSAASFATPTSPDTAAAYTRMVQTPAERGELVKLPTLAEREAELARRKSLGLPHAKQAEALAIGDNVLMTRCDPAEVDDLAPGVLFDIDGTLVALDCYNGTPDQQMLRPGVLETLLRLQATGLRMAAVTNRSEYPGGNDLDHVIEMNDDVMAKCGGTLRDVYCMAHGPSEYHKPAPFMLLEAMKREGIDPKQCLYVGDSDDDRKAAEAAGIQFADAETFFGGAA